MAVMSRAAMWEYFVRRQPTLGEWLLWTKRDTVAIHTSPVWSLANAVVVAAFPPGIDLKAERLEHVQLFNLFGDPTMPLAHPRPVTLKVADTAVAGAVMHVAGMSPVEGTAVIELESSIDQCRIPRRGQYESTGNAAEQFDAVYQAANNPRWASATVAVENRHFSADLEVPKNLSGRCHVRVFVEGANDFALGSTEVRILATGDSTVSSSTGMSTAPRENR
jgi:hypothetical protein